MASRFDKIKETCLDVTDATQDQIQREQKILDAYQDFRGALKQSEVLALEVLKTAQGAPAAARAEVDAAMQAVESHSGGDAVARARLEMVRDEKVRALQHEDKRCQIAKGLSDNLTVSHNIVSRLLEREAERRRLEASVRGLRETISQHRRRLSELEALRVDFKRRRYDRAGSAFGDDAMIGMMMGQFLNGLLDCGPPGLTVAGMAG